MSLLLVPRPAHFDLYIITNLTVLASDALRLPSVRLISYLPKRVPRRDVHAMFLGSQEQRNAPRYAD
ncbi:hypothetical protein CBOM_07800 [Ceraceosorus bombacis]|uniref:Uncharacterized protein n=1 Tax=Ceraceosorus bombacis TaxID=401625 RepID=A0A0P1BNQ0_9BASI|nr:hypothetical protein CBOM_07800 [Ceraceosorus bombacis]